MPERDIYINSSSPIETELKLIFNLNDSLTIFDIGSCEGEDSIRYSKLFPNSQIYAVEPVPSNIKLIESNLQKYSIENVNIIPYAFSDTVGQSKFYISSGKPSLPMVDEVDWDYGNKSSSLLQPEKHTEIYPWVKFSETIEVQTTTLENFCDSQQIKNIDFIHMDVQGAELQVLKGYQNFLRNVTLIWLEVESLELYKNQPLKKDIETFMLQNNFIKIKDTVNSVTGDQLYLNSAFFFQMPFFKKARLFLNKLLLSTKNSK